MKNIVIIASRFPLPASGGREKMILQLLDILSKSGYRIYFFCPRAKDYSGRKKLGEVFQGVVWEEHVQAPRIIEIAFNIIQGLSIQESLFFSRKSLRLIQSRMEGVSVDVLYIDMVRMGPYHLPHAKMLAMDFDDLLSLRYIRLLRADRLGVPLIGTYADKVSMLTRLCSRLVPARLLLKYESHKIKKRELYYARVADLLLFVSAREASIFSKTIRSLGIKKPVIALPPATTPEFCRIPRIGFNLVFIGNTAAAHNLVTIKRIVSNILTLLPSNFKLMIVGHASEELSRFLRHASEGDRVDALGFVDDMRSLAMDADILLSPLVFGTGIKLKILQAFSLGIPVITNEIGSEGIPIVDGFHAILAETDREFANACIKLSRDIELQRKLISNSQSLLADGFCLESIKNRLLIHLGGKS